MINKDRQKKGPDYGQTSKNLTDLQTGLYVQVVFFHETEGHLKTKAKARGILCRGIYVLWRRRRDLSDLLLLWRHMMEKSHEASGGRSHPEGTSIFRFVSLPLSVLAKKKKKKRHELFIKK